ncbi:MAG: helix-turn-helix transcriptional regulator [Nitrospirota bacterium]
MVKYKSTTYSAAIGEKIRALRKQFGLSQERLGEIAGVTYQQIQKYENGTDRISTDRLNLIAEGLNIPINYFFEEKSLKVKEKEVLYHTIGELSKEELELIKIFRKVKGKKAREKFFGLIKSATKFISQR